MNSQLSESTPSARKYIYSFGVERTEGSGDLKELLGGKGAGLAEMSRLGIPVPPGFTLTTEACRYYHAHDCNFPDGLEKELQGQLQSLEATLGQHFGDPRRPLLVSVRSGGPVSMPGMMDTILNLGLNDEIVAAASGAEGAFVRDCYRRLLSMFAEVVLGQPAAPFEQSVREALRSAGVDRESELDAAAWDRVIVAHKATLEEQGGELPQDPMAQLWAAIGAVFNSWNNRRAREYRRLHELPEDQGTGVNVQAMVFGNRGEDCATGVMFTRDPSSGARRLYGEYLVNAQGEDVVAGTHTPQPILTQEASATSLAQRFPEAFAALESVSETLERHFRNMQDLEFTIQGGRLYLLQTRAGKRSGPAAVRIAVDMVRERLIDRREALRRVEPQHLVQMMAPELDREDRKRAIAEGRLLARGLAAGPGAAAGRIAFTADKAAAMAQEGPVLLVRDETSPEDIVGMHASCGILTTRGGMTSHAAVVARGLGKPCIVGAADLVVDDVRQELRAGERTFTEGSELSIDGLRGEVLEGALKTHPSEVIQALVDGAHGGEGGGRAGRPLVDAFLTILGWADRERRLEVRANADTPEDARIAAIFGAGGIGLCRTEHMFFADDRIPWVRQMILAADDDSRQQALSQLLPMQQGDFEEIYRALAGLPVTIRLLDPPLHEFLPHGEAGLTRLGQQMGLDPREVALKAEALVEVNPMLGHRGCRLGITAPEIYEMQVEAIARAACSVARDGIEVRPEIMIPLVGVEEELRQLRSRVEERVARVLATEGLGLDIAIGTMIEVPRAALQASEIARHADFFSFGTNDLTQMTFGYSRDDVGRFLPSYLEKGVLRHDPFERLDREGVGQLVELASRRGRMAKPELKLGVCGEHGGEPFSIEFFERCGLDYVSCSPYRVPVARLAAARARLAYGPGSTQEPDGEP